MSDSNPKFSPGFVEPGVIYRADEFKRRVGWSEHAMRTARRGGLRVIRTGGRAYVKGDDAIAYFDKVAAGNEV